MAVRVWSWLLVAGCSFRAGGGGAALDAADSPATAADAPVDLALDGPRTGWWNAAWRQRIRVTVDNTKLIGSGTLQELPVFVTLPAPVDATSLRFVSSDDTTVYPHEVELVPATGGVLAWVRLPTLMPTGPKPTLWAYFDNPAAASSSSGPAVWSARHTSVHHLGATLEDSTGNGHTGTASGSPMIAPGRFGSARSFDGGDWIELAGEDSYDYTTAMYVSAWFRVATFDAPYQAIVTKGDSAWRLARGDQTDGAGFGTTSGNQNQNANGGSNLDNSQWHFVAGVLDGSTKTLYVDGTAAVALVYTLQLDNNQFAVRIGMNPESTVGGPRYWKGEIDEVRISAVPRTASWIHAEWVVGSDPAFVTTGTAEPY